MVTHLRVEDLPQPWHSSRKTNGGTQGRNSSRSALSTVEEGTVQNMRKGRGRPCGKSSPKVFGPPKGMKRTKAVAPVPVNVLLTVSETSVANIEELRQKRQQDARAAGRTVRIISPRPHRESSPLAVMGNASEENRDIDIGGGRSSKSPESSRQGQQTEDKSAENDEAVTVVEKGKEGNDLVFLRRSGKEPAANDVDERIPPYERENDNRRRLGDNVDVDNDDDSPNKNDGQRDGRQFPDRSFSQKYPRQVYKGRQSRTIDAADEGHRSSQQRSQKSMSRSPRRERYRSSREPENWSPRRRDCGSPGRRRDGRQQRSGFNIEEYGKYAFARVLDEVCRNQEGFDRGDRRHRRQSESISPDRFQRHWRSQFRELASAIHQRKSSTYSSLSPQRRSMSWRDAMEKEGTDSGAVKAEDIAETSAASDRRRRRQEQTFLEAEKVKRKREGNKPFYLTLDREGKPYGPGRPAWIAEINKLAKWLDPSCTHIRKQTFEAVQTFRDRLDENFEYGGTLNEDYLRALMGKAVTKKRAQLINFIRDGGKDVTQPVYIDHEVWLRLQKLATSQQREERSEQGRYANSCRTVIGRTGRRGIDGVREKLRSLFGRSPDPSEVEEEMHRDKGYGGRKRKSNVQTQVEENTSSKMKVVEELMHFGGSTAKSQAVEGVADDAENVNCFGGPVAERRGLAGQYVDEELDEVTGRSGDGPDSSESAEAEKRTKEDYIKKLEARIKLLQNEKANAWTSKTDVAYKKRMK